MEVKTKEKLVTISPTARETIQKAMDSQDMDNLFLRIYVQGGCGGIQYGMAIDSRTQEGDSKYNIEGMDVVIDRISLPYVEGVTVDFDDSDSNPGFRITHPNPEMLAPAGGSCCSTDSGGSCGGGSCGTSSGGGCC